MFCKKIKNLLLVLISLSIICTTSFALDKTIVTEEVLVNNIKIAKTKNKKEKALKKLFYYYVNMNRWNDVINMSNDLLKCKLTEREKYTVYYNLAVAYLFNKKFEAAIDAAQEAEYLYPKKIDVKMLMGEIYRDNSLYELAITKFKDVLSLDEKHVTASINLGNIYRMQENYKEALKYYTKAIELRNNLPKDVYINTAVSYKEIGMYGEAIEVLKNVKGKNKSAALILADIYQTKQNFSKAKNTLQPYVYGRNLDLEIYCKLAELCILSKDYNEAKKLMLFYKGKTKNKNTEIVDFLLAETYYETNDKKNAVKIMNNILKYTKSNYIKDMVRKTLKIRKL